MRNLSPSNWHIECFGLNSQFQSIVHVVCSNRAPQSRPTFSKQIFLLIKSEGWGEEFFLFLPDRPFNSNGQENRLTTFIRICYAKSVNISIILYHNSNSLKKVCLKILRPDPLIAWVTNLIRWYKIIKFDINRINNEIHQLQHRLMSKQSFH